MCIGDVYGRIGNPIANKVHFLGEFEEIDLGHGNRRLIDDNLGDNVAACKNNTATDIIGQEVNVGAETTKCSGYLPPSNNLQCLQHVTYPPAIRIEVSG